MKLSYLLIFLATHAQADVGELSVRPHAEVRYGPLSHPDPQRPGVAEGDGEALRYGGGLAAGLGLAFAWTLTLSYGWDTTTLGRQPLDRQAPQDLDRWTHDRHLLTAGVVWAPSDALTPIFALEGGVAATHLRDIRAEQNGTTSAVGETILDLAPAARARLGLEWKFLDFWSVALEGFAEHADGIGYGGRLWLGTYRYL